MSQGRTVLRGLVVAMIALGLAGCSLGEKQAQGERITRSIGRLARAGPVSGEATWEFRIEEIPPGAVGDFATLVRRLAPVKVPFVADLGRDRAQLGPVGEPSALYAGDAVFVRRSGSSTGLSSREWSRLDYRDLDDVDTPGVQAVADNIGSPTVTLLHPVHLLELVTGALTGSVRRLGTETIAGVRTTHYKANVSLDKADGELDLSEQERDARRAALTSLAVKGDVLPAEMWVDDAGRLRRLQIRFTQRPARRATLSFAARLDLAAIGEGELAGVPARRQYLRVDTPSELVRGLRSAPAATPTPPSLPPGTPLTIPVAPPV